MFHKPVVKHGVNGELRAKGKIAELACGYGGSTGALKAMGALEMGLSEDELPDIVSSWRDANQQIVKFWWDVDKAVMAAVKNHKTTRLGRLAFFWKAGMLFITLPSGRSLAYVKPKVGMNRFGGECITYEGVGGTKKWERLESYGPKFVENIVQATSRDILCNSMKSSVIATSACMSTTSWLSKPIRTSPWKCCASRWDASLLGRTVWCSARTVTSAISIRKTESVSSKAACPLQWEVEAGRFFYCLPERRIPVWITGILRAIRTRHATRR